MIYLYHYQNIIPVTVLPLLRYIAIEDLNWTSGPGCSAAASWKKIKAEEWVTTTINPGQIICNCSNSLITIEPNHPEEIQIGSIINIPYSEYNNTGNHSVKKGGKIFALNQLQSFKRNAGVMEVESN